MTASKKNTHLEHLEDDIINLGYRGAQQSIEFVEALLDLFAGHTKNSVNVTVKWDGAPAIVAGIDPQTKNFFVATKHGAFAKSMKLGFNEEMIDFFYEGDLAKILKIAFNELKDLGIKEVLQGDIMFTHMNKKNRIIDGKEYVTFKPNTILYAIPTDDPLREKIEKSNIGIIFHTKYSGVGPVNEMSATFGVDVSRLKSSTAWIEDASYKDLSGSVTLTSSETKEVQSKLASAKRNALAARRFLDDIAAQQTSLSPGYIFKIFVNRLVRDGIDVNQKTLTGFEKFVIERISAKEGTVKTAKGKERYIGLRLELQKYLRSNSMSLRSMFVVYENLIDIKGILIKKLNAVKRISTFIETETGFKVTDPEGFVAIDRFGNAVKLVNRMEFSKANFNAVKDWTKPAARPSENLPKLRTIVFSFGRLNPPTIGHGKLIDRVLEISREEKCDHLVIISHTQDKKKNPLKAEDKLRFAKLMFPRAKIITSTQQIPTFMKFLEEFNDKYDRVIMVAGSDKVDEYRKVIGMYIGKTFNFKVINVSSSGMRDPDADDASGMSATKMREFAKNDDFTNFKKGLPSTMREKDAQELFQAVREGMEL